MSERMHVVASRTYVRCEPQKRVQLVAIVTDRLGKAGPALALTISRRGTLERHVFGMTRGQKREIAWTLRKIADFLDALEE